MDHTFFSGIVIGLLFGIPAGAVGALTIQRTLDYGVKAGLLTGLGSSAADCFYAGIGAFGLTVISDFLLDYQEVIGIIGGNLIVVMGTSLLTGKRKQITLHSQAAGGVTLFLSSFVIGITNPAAVLTFLFAFSLFGLSGHMGILAGIRLVLGVFLGTYLWWGGLSAGVSLLKKRKKTDSFRNSNRVFGVILMCFGLVIVFKTAFT